jgi:hypothetical protein
VDERGGDAALVARRARLTTVRFTRVWDEEAVRSHEDGWGKAFDNLERELS